MPLDIAFGRRLDLQYRRNQWASHAMLGKQELRGVAAYVVGGDWREYATAVVSGSYRMWITEAGDLIRYEESGVVALPDPGRAGAMSAQNVSSIWDVDLHPDVPTDHSLYVLP